MENIVITEKNETITALHLLNSITIIRNKYDDIAKITGENFNIFRIMGSETYEKHPHSSLISELLNEKGSHGQGRVFLDLFLQFINTKINDEKESRITSGKNYGLKCEPISNFINSSSTTEKYTGDGFIDIYIENTKQLIIIENKIGAEHQHHQLLNYYNHALKTNKEFIIVYLWKFDAEFDDSEFDKKVKTFGEDECERKKIKEKTISISYKNDIKSWIEECIKVSATLPLVRETLIQYLHTVNSITKQSTNNKMSEDINKILLLGNNFKIAEIIKIEFDNTIKFLENNFRNALSLRLNNILTDIKVSDFVIKFEISEDIGGLYYGAFISKEGTGINPLTEATFDSIISNFKNQNNTTFKINTNHIFLGWINIIGDNQKYINIPNETKVLLYKDSTELNIFLDNIYSKCQVMYNLIK